MFVIEKDKGVRLISKGQSCRSLGVSQTTDALRYSTEARLSAWLSCNVIEFEHHPCEFPVSLLRFPPYSAQISRRALRWPCRASGGSSSS